MGGQVVAVGSVGALSPRNGRTARRVCAVILAAEIAVAAVALGTHGSGSGAPSAGRGTGAVHHPVPAATTPAGPTADPTPAGPTSAAAQARSSALTWLTQRLPHTAAVLTDATVATELTVRGFRAAGRPAHPQYTVSTPALRRLAGRQSTVAEVLRTSVPIAVFTARDGRLVIGQVVGVPAATVSAHRLGDAQLRLGAGRALAANPTVSAAPAARTALIAGDVDLRAATALALMAANGRVDLLSVTTVRSEDRAGLPARTLTFRAAPEADQRALLLGLDGEYRPQSWVRLPDGSYRATWPIRPDPDDTRR